MSWADSDTESDADNAAPPPKKLDAFGESESDSEDEVDDEEPNDSAVRFRKPSNPISQLRVWSANFPTKSGAPVSKLNQNPEHTPGHQCFRSRIAACLAARSTIALRLSDG